MDKIDNNVDMIVFGAGPAGLAAASLGLYQGRNVIVIEAGKHCAGRNSAGRGSAAGRGSGQGVSSRIVALTPEGRMQKRLLVQPSHYLIVSPYTTV